MDIRSLRMLLGWSREELAQRSGVSFASVCLVERMGTAGSKDDALMSRALLEGHKRRSPELLTGIDAVPLEYANDNAATMPATEPQSQPARREGRPPTASYGDMKQLHCPSHAYADGRAALMFGREPHSPSTGNCQ